MALQDLLRLLPFRVRYMLGLVAPIAGGSPEGEGEGEGDGEGEGSGDGEGSASDGEGEGSGDDKAGEGDSDGDEGDGDGDGDGEGKGETVAELKRRLRLTERQGKNASKRDKARIAKLEADAKKREDAAKSESEKAIEAAREEGATAAKTEFQKERRSDRLALAVTRLAGKGVKVGEGDDAEQVKFTDKGALVLLERALDSGDIDTSDIFDDADKVRDDGLRGAVAQLLEDEEYLIVRPASNGQDKGKGGGSDAGKGGGSGTKTLEEMTPDDHLKQVQQR